MLKLSNKKPKRTDENQILLSNAICQAEETTSAEIVAIVKAKSNNYFDYVLMHSVLFMFIVFTILMFLPTVFGDYLFYILTLLGFIFPAIVIQAFIPLKRVLVPKKAKRQSVEIKARAVFQKAGISLTRQRIGILIYCSIFEKITYIIADEGVKRSIPYAVLEKLEIDFQNAICTASPIQTIADEILNMKTILSLYLPKTPDDINELPDYLNIEI
jgi:putative membrane protein